MGRMGVFGSMLAALAWVACGGEDGGQAPYVRTGVLDAQVEDRCVDADGDGYGVGCDLGADCDDDDVEVTDLCLRCPDDEISEGCPCEPGTEAAYCDPKEVADRETTEDGSLGVLKCSEAERYCTDGEWGPCTGVGWTFQAY